MSHLSNGHIARDPPAEVQVAARLVVGRVATANSCHPPPQIKKPLLTPPQDIRGDSSASERGLEMEEMEERANGGLTDKPLLVIERSRREADEPSIGFEKNLARKKYK